MPVSVPRINRIESGGGSLPQNDRIRVQAQDSAGLINAQSGAIVDATKQIANVYENYENDKIDQISNLAEMEYKTWHDGELQKLKSMEGDPTLLYQDYETKAKEKYDQILQAYPDLNTRVSGEVGNRLGATMAKNRMSMLYQKGAQEEVYDNNIYESKLKLDRDSLPENVGFINAKDPESTFFFDDNLNSIKTTVAKQGLKKGIVMEVTGDEFDYAYKENNKVVKVKFSDIAKQRLGKELSQGVKDSLDVLVASNKIDTARFVESKYGSHLDAKDKAKIQNSIKEYSEKNAGYNFVSSIQSLPKEEQIKRMEGIKNPKIKEEALKVLDSIDNKLENIKKRADEENYAKLDQEIFEMRRNNPSFSTVDLENMESYKLIKEKGVLSAKSTKALYEQVEAPKNSDPKQVAKIQKLLLGEDPDFQIETISDAAFRKDYLAGLDSSERSFYEKKFLALRAPSESEKRAKFSYAKQALKDNGVLEKLLTKKYGYLTPDSEREAIKMNKELMDIMDKSYGAFNPSQIDKLVNDYVASKVNGTSLVVEDRRQRRDMPMTETTNREYKRRYMESVGSDAIPENTDPRFLDWLEENYTR